jgi:hypothetical protein
VAASVTLKKKFKTWTSESRDRWSDRSREVFVDARTLPDRGSLRRLHPHRRRRHLQDWTPPAQESGPALVEVYAETVEPLYFKNLVEFLKFGYE